jgi:hypothetical protein
LIYLHKAVKTARSTQHGIAATQRSFLPQWAQWETAQHSRNQIIFSPQRLLEPLMDTDKLKTLGRAAWERQFPHWQETREKTMTYVCI